MNRMEFSQNRFSEDGVIDQNLTVALVFPLSPPRESIEEGVEAFDGGFDGLVIIVAFAIIDWNGFCNRTGRAIIVVFGFRCRSVRWYWH